MPGEIGRCLLDGLLVAGLVFALRRNMAWQEDAENCADADCRIAEHIAAGLLDDAVDHRKAEAGSFADLFGREERLENLFANVIRNSSAGVGHFNHHIIGGGERFLVQLRRVRRRQIAVRNSILPPFGIASRALTTRLMTTCSN